VSTFEERLKEVDGLITGKDKPRNFVAAYVEAQRLTQDFLDEPSAWRIYILTCYLNDSPGDALAAHNAARELCSAWTPIDTGDFARDSALYHIRHSDPVEAKRYLDAAWDYHENDDNRRAVLNMAEGRLAYSVGDLESALQLYARARDRWKQLDRRISSGKESEPPNCQWQFNCDRWALKALVKQGHAKSDGAQAIWSALQVRMAEYGSPDLNARLKLIMKFGRLGNKLDDFIESPRGQRFVNDHPRLEKLLRRFLTKR
jgi:hypothetical protein